MSRIAKYPVILPPKVEVSIKGGQVDVKGPAGALSRNFGADVTIKNEDGKIQVTAAGNSMHAKAMSGTARALIANMVNGCATPFEKKLTLVGVGYRAQAAGDKLNLSLGFSHPIVHAMPKGVTVATPTQTEIIIKGSDRQQVGQIAAEIRAYKPPEPYKGKGVRYFDEKITLKETKKK